MNNINYMKLEIPSKSQNESFARVVVAAFAAQLNPIIEELNDIKTAVSEAVTNAIIHGYNEAEGIITIYATIKNSTFFVEVIDQGVGIDDIEKAKEPLYTTRPELERSGMGFTIMDNFMDKLELKSKVGQGTTVRMTKIIKKRTSLDN